MTEIKLFEAERSAPPLFALQVREEKSGKWEAHFPFCVIMYLRRVNTMTSKEAS